MRNPVTSARTTLLALSLLAGTLIGSAGCVDAIDRILNCQSICSRYADCFDEDYDVGACRDRCDDKASHSSDFDHTVDMCDACIDDRSCTSATFNCGTQCATIVP